MEQRYIILIDPDNEPLPFHAGHATWRCDECRQVDKCFHKIEEEALMNLSTSIYNSTITRNPPGHEQRHGRSRADILFYAVFIGGENLPPGGCYQHSISPDDPTTSNINRAVLVGRYVLDNVDALIEKLFATGRFRYIN
jgi:hypothetical protein